MLFTFKVFGILLLNRTLFETTTFFWLIRNKKQWPNRDRLKSCKHIIIHYQLILLDFTCATSDLTSPNLAISSDDTFSFGGGST